MQNTNLLTKPGSVREGLPGDQEECACEKEQLEKKPFQCREHDFVILPALIRQCVIVPCSFLVARKCKSKCVHCKMPFN